MDCCFALSDGFGGGGAGGIMIPSRREHLATKWPWYIDLCNNIILPPLPTGHITLHNFNFQHHKLVLTLEMYQHVILNAQDNDYIFKFLPKSTCLVVLLSCQVGPERNQVLMILDRHSTFQKAFKNTLKAVGL